MEEPTHLGKGNFRNIGVYAARDFKTGEVVVFYNWQELSKEDFKALDKQDHAFVHSFWGKRFLFNGHSRYVNHSSNPTTYQDLNKMADIAMRDIRKDEPITTSASQEIINELKTFIEAFENTSITNFKKSKGGYRNAEVSYVIKNKQEKIKNLKRIDGNWQIVDKIN